MARRVYNFEHPDRFTAGTVGEPGNRSFYLQAREGDRISSVLLEKIQVALLAERLTQLLSEIHDRGVDLPAEPSPADVDRGSLDEPINELFRVGSMTIVWNGEDQSVTLEARALGDDEEAVENAFDPDDDDDAEDDENLDVMRVHLSPVAASAFARRAGEVVAAGRPPCPFCGQPLNPEGHICTRRNGFMH